MNILEVLKQPTGTPVNLKAVVCGADLSAKQGGGNFLSLSLCDASGRISFPIFDDVETMYEKLNEGQPYYVTGRVNVWNGNVQIKNATFKAIEEGDYSASDFIASYNISPGLEKSFKIKINSLDEPYRSVAMRAVGLGVNDGMWERFMTAPSAEKYHGSKLGGLALHTLGVMANVSNMIKVYDNIGVYGDARDVINESRLMLKALVHDVMKVEEYEYSSFIRRKPGVVGHLIDGCGYLQVVNTNLKNEGKPHLSDEDLEDVKQSILSHHGQYGPYEPKTVENTLIHLADMIDSRIVGELEKK